MLSVDLNAQTGHLATQDARASMQLFIKYKVRTHSHSPAGSNFSLSRQTCLFAMHNLKRTYSHTVLGQRKSEGCGTSTSARHPSTNDAGQGLQLPVRRRLSGWILQKDVHMRSTIVCQRLNSSIQFLLRIKFTRHLENSNCRNLSAYKSSILVPSSPFRCQSDRRTSYRLSL